MNYINIRKQILKLITSVNLWYNLIFVYLIYFSSGDSLMICHIFILDNRSSSSIGLASIFRLKGSSTGPSSLLSISLLTAGESSGMFIWKMASMSSFLVNWFTWFSSALAAMRRSSLVRYQSGADAGGLPDLLPWAPQHEWP